MKHEQQVAYWKRNLSYIVVLLGIEFAVSYFAGIMIADQLDTVKIAGFPLGFFFGNQGSMWIFVALIFIYVKLMNGLDKQYGVYEN